MRAQATLLACAMLLAGCSRATDEHEHAPNAEALLAPSLRRLSVAEISAAASALVGGEVDFGAELPPDARQQDFSRSLTQSVDALTLKRLDDATRALASRIDLAAPSLPPCARDADDGDVACAHEVAQTLATIAFRRSPSDDELAELDQLFEAGATDTSFRDGVALLVRALLGSPNLLYDTALGESDQESGSIALSDDELASQLGWLVSGLPPDAELQRAARAGELQNGTARGQQAERLLQDPRSRLLYQRFVEEWLGLNRLGSLAKSTSVIADFSALRGPLLRETDAVIDDVMATSSGSLALLFAGQYSHVPSEVAALYGIAAPPAEQRVSLRQLGRVGLLQHASFLATFAHEDSSAPVLRGKAVLERLLCRTLPNPAELGIELVLPAPNPNATTRQRFAEHAQSSRCSVCHDAIDGVGFSFENFDAVGRLRDTEAGGPVDTSGSLELDGQTITLKDSVELAQALASSEELQACAARQLVRFASGGRAPEVEDDFVRATRPLPGSERGSLVGLLLAYVRGDWFSRRTRP